MTRAGWIERVVNLHIHTVDSDGTGEVGAIADAAAEAGVDAVVITDHNVYRPDQEGWYGPVLVLVGEELHDPQRPHQNHLLMLGAGCDLATETASLQGAIDHGRRAGGLPIIAHPIEHSGAAAGEREIDWVDRSIQGLHGIEIWNYMSEFKSYIHSLAHGLLYAFMPDLAITGPYPETLRLWDALLAQGTVYAYGGSDAHANRYKMGPISRVILAYRHLFTAVNTHVLVHADWTGSVEKDAALVYEGLGQGRSFVGYDRPASTRGTQFVAERGDHRCTFGGRLGGTGQAQLRISLPARAEIRLLRDGRLIREVRGTSLSVDMAEPGVYRFEAWRSYRGRRVSWIFGNPIWV